MKVDKNKIVVLGNGFLGSSFKDKNYIVLGSDSLRFHVNCDVYNNNLLDNLKQYDVIINTIAKTNTRGCESNNKFEETLYINGMLPKLISSYCKIHRKKYVHISTGCLYDTPFTPHKETDYVSTHCVYTLTKRCGELNCDLNRDLIIRPRLLFNHKNTNKNFLRRLFDFKFFVYDANDSLTSTDTVIEAIEALLSSDQSGIYNVCQIGCPSISLIARDICGIKPVTDVSINFVRKHAGIYLVNSIMDTSKLENYYIPRKISDEINKYLKIKEW